MLKDRRGEERDGGREGGREREKVEGVGGKGRSEERRVGRKKRGKRAWRKGGSKEVNVLYETDAVTSVCVSYITYNNNTK